MEEEIEDRARPYYERLGDLPGVDWVLAESDGEVALVHAIGDNVTTEVLQSVPSDEGITRVEFNAKSRGFQLEIEWDMGHTTAR